MIRSRILGFIFDSFFFIVFRIFIVVCLVSCVIFLLKTTDERGVRREERGVRIVRTNLKIEDIRYFRSICCLI